MLKKYDKEEILKCLHYIDDKLSSEYNVQICGSAAVLLQGYDFRKTFDLDFVKPLDSVVSAVVQRIYKEHPDIFDRFYDDQAANVVCLFEDYEDRLVEIKDDFKYLKVYVLSLVDWIISKLESRKFADLFEYPLATMEHIKFIEENMELLYCGSNEYEAKFSLNILKSELTEK